MQLTRDWPMRLQNLVAVVIVAALIGYVAFRWNGDVVALARENMIAFTAGSVAAALVLVAAVIVLGLNLKHQRTLLREARRVVARNPDAAADARSDKGGIRRETTAPAPELMSLLGTIERTEARRAGKPVARPDPDAELRLAPHLFYQPVVALAGSQVNGYDVYRMVRQRDVLTEPLFAQMSTAADVERRAGFEMDMIESTLAAARQVFSQAEPAARGAVLYVHVSEALLDHQTHWSKLAMLLAAHPSLSAQITLCLAATALQDPPSGRLDAVDRMLDADAGVGVTGLDFTVDALPDYLARALQVAMYEHHQMQDNESEKTIGRLDCLSRLTALGVPGCARGLVSDVDIVDAIQQGATLGSGPVFAEPMRLRDQPRRADRPGQPM